VAWAREAIAIAEVARATSRNGATLCIREAEDWVAVAEQEVSEPESRAEAEHSAALTFARADAKGLARTIALLESELAKERRAWETSEREH
jgi:3-deoxy-D-manno-octulosonic-acid transferase